MKVYLFETKTSSEDIGPGSTFWKRTVLDPQLSLYIPALRALGHDPHGCVYDVLRKPALEPKMATPIEKREYTKKDGKLYKNQRETDETPAEYYQRCLDAIAEKPERYYARGVVVRLEDEIHEAAADTWNTASQMREAKRLTIYPRNPDSCISWSRECDYLSVCARMADIHDPLLFQYEPAHVELDPGEGGLSDDLSLLTQSSMRCYRSCPRKFQLRYMMRMRPLKKAATLSTGSSIHAALEAYRKTGGDLEAAKKALLTEDLFVRAKETAMIIGYAARWGKPVGIVEVEHQFRIPLVNPETGAASRTFSLGGKVDAIVAVEAVGELMNPALAEENLESQLETSLAAHE
jgi:PD-(D/E)XK nuclease superfamily